MDSTVGITIFTNVFPSRDYWRIFASAANSDFTTIIWYGLTPSRIVTEINPTFIEEDTFQEQPNRNPIFENSFRIRYPCRNSEHYHNVK